MWIIAGYLDNVSWCVIINFKRHTKYKFVCGYFNTLCELKTFLSKLLFVLIYFDISCIPIITRAFSVFSGELKQTILYLYILWAFM